MNSANQTLQAIRQQKAYITKAKNEAIEIIEEKYAHDMNILEEEEKELLKQFKDIPVNDIYE